MKRPTRSMLALIGLGMVLIACTSPATESPQVTTTVRSSAVVPTSLPEEAPPLGWQSVAVPIGVEAVPVGVWSVGSGFVLAAVAEDADLRRLFLWRSSDGVDWVPEESPGPAVVDRALVDMADEEMVVVVRGVDGWDALALSGDGAAWRTVEPDIGWIPESWRQLDGFQYVRAGYEVSGVEVGPQGVAAVLTRDTYVDFETAVREALPDLVDPFELIIASPNLDGGTIDLEGIRDYPDQTHSLCDVYRTHYDVAHESLGSFDLEDIGIDPVLAREVRSQAWSRMLWHSSDLELWSLDELVANGDPVHMSFGTLTDIGAGYVASLGGDLGYSVDGIEWEYSDRRTEDRYFNVDDLAWNGQELVVASWAHNSTGSANDSYDIWAGSFFELRPVVVAPDDRIVADSYMHHVDMAAGPAGIAVIGSNRDANPARSKVWLVEPDDRIERDLDYVSRVSPRIAVGTQRLVVTSKAVSAMNELSGVCETTLTIDSYLGD